MKSGTSDDDRGILKQERNLVDEVRNAHPLHNSSSNMYVMHKAEQDAHTVVQCVHCCGKARTLEISGVPRTWTYGCGRFYNCRTSAILDKHEPTSPSSLGDAALQPPAITSPQLLLITLSIKGCTVMQLNCGQNWMIAVVLITKLFSGWSHLALCAALDCRGQYV